jgi:very-short-patch-repair endonuclease/type II restriction/modification system DNA methylase subunit YeeA
MELKALKPRKSLNKAFLKLKPNRSDIETFKTNLIELIDRSNPNESEEFHKNLITEFLRKTYYRQSENFINTKGRNDLVIYNGKDSKNSVGVIIEAKKSSNKSEMLSLENINVKAFHELILYYLRERISEKNLDIKHIIATNINEWFIFEANVFEKLFASNKNLVKQFTDFEEGRLSGKNTDFFYSEIAKPYVESLKSEIIFTHFNLREYEKPLRNEDKKDDTKLVALFKLFSPEHLLKLPFANDSNSLDKRFYSELLHIIGLTETKQGSKKLIERKPENERNVGSFLENAIIQLDSLDKISRLENPRQYGNNLEERLFSIGLELSITWINRILFLKLLEAQLIKYHKGNKDYSFLNLKKIQNYDDLNTLFFQVLAKKHESRNIVVKNDFEKVPFLNSSLFEPSEIEHTTILISNLRDDQKLPILSSTVLKDNTGKKRTGELTTLEYLFEFLDSYDFSSEGAEDIQEDNKTLINASVLGLIFEKINGYKDGSFFTPGFITMYMCRETIRRAVLQKFNEAVAGQPPPLERGHGGVSKRHIIPYNPILKEYARKLRNKCTKSEAILWKQLKGKFENKYDFHRQKPLDNYIADFFCYELALVIEIDGETHNLEKTKKKDFAKEIRFNELGINVLRFPDTEVFETLDGLIDTVREYIHGFEKGDLSGFRRVDTPLNPLTRGDFAYSLPGKSPSDKRFESLTDVYNEIGKDGMFSINEANNIVNSIKICDPAVGSGHFLVSALNEIIAVKNDLKILQDREGKRLKEYQIEVVNDELIVTDEDGELFEYTPPSPLQRGQRGVSESQRIQETLFHEKQTIIESCLFGVDINPNSVKICRLRLWIELLKNAYYKNEKELETLPNIDINIKCGNSLVSRFSLDSDLKQALKRSKWSIDMYRIAVQTYRNAENKEQKHEMEKLIKTIKNDFRSEIAANSKELKDLSKWKGELDNLVNQTTLFEKTAKEKKEFDQKAKILTEKIKKQENLIEEIKNNKIYENAFEWRFEFPEVLDDDGEFVGFDVCIGNPPYIRHEDLKCLKPYLKTQYQIYNSTADILTYFVEQSYKILKNKGAFQFIISNKFTRANYGKELRYFLKHNTQITHYIDFSGINVFDEASVDAAILGFIKIFPKEKDSFLQINIAKKDLSIQNFNFEFSEIDNLFKQSALNPQAWSFENKQTLDIKQKVEKLGILLKEWQVGIYRGLITGLNDAFIINNNIKEQILSKDPLCINFLKPVLRGRNIKPYETDYQKEWIILIPKGYTIKTMLEIKEDMINEPTPRYGYVEYDEAWEWIKRELPSIAEHLGQFREQAEKRFDKGDYWWELRACAYLKEFEKPKIIYKDIAQRLTFSYDENAYFTNNTNYFITGNVNLKYLTAILNSKLMDFYYRLISTQLGENAVRLFTQYVENIPIKQISETEEAVFSSLIDEIILCKSESKDTSKQESEIDRLVYELYGLSEEEIAVVEGSV